MRSMRGLVSDRTPGGDAPEEKWIVGLRNGLAYILLVTLLVSSCVEWREVVAPVAEGTAKRELTEAEIASAEEWISSRIGEGLEQVLKERIVHITAEERLRFYRETWGEETPHVELFFGDYVVRLPVEEIDGYPWGSVAHQLETGELGPVLLRNGWEVWLGYVEKVDAVTQDMEVSVREACSQLAKTGDTRRDEAVQRVCGEFRSGFQFGDDLELFRRLWHSSFEVEDPRELGVSEALATFFLADLKRIIAPRTAEEHVAEVWTPGMKGFEFGDGTSEHGFRTVLFDERNQVTVLFLPPAPYSEPPDGEFRERVVASVERHRRWAPGQDMIREAESVLELTELDNSREVGSLLLFSSLQFPDHKARAATMLVNLFPPGTTGREEIIEIVSAMILGPD